MPFFRPSILELILLVELVLLVTLAGYRLVAHWMGRTNTNDPWTIFYTVFWQAFLHPKHFPYPIEYRPDRPATKKAGFDEKQDAEDLDDFLEDVEIETDANDLDALVAASSASPSAPAAPARAPARPAVARGAAATASPPADEDQGGLLTGFFDVMTQPPTGGEDADQIVMLGGRLVVYTPFGPEDGRSNRAALDAAARVLHVKPHQVSLHRGHNKPLKTLRVTGLTQDDLNTRLSQLA